MLFERFFPILSLFGGIALFLYGMRLLSEALSKLAGGGLERVLKGMTRNRLTALLAGIGVTAAVQSSSAVTVMLVGLVNSGLLSFGQTIGILFGSNIGTTLTAWLFSLAGVAESSFFVQLLKPTSLFPILAVWGILLLMGGNGSTDKATRRRVIGTVLFGLAILFCGMKQMSDAVAPLADAEEFGRILAFFTSPLAGLLLGTVFTALIQSSSASIGILQALAITGKLPAAVAIPMIFGQNIGTCVTTLLAALGTGRSAKRVATVHISFNVIGSALGLLALYLARLFPVYDALTAPISAAGVALVHTCFNVGTTLLLLPFASLLERLACRLIPEEKEPAHTHSVFLDPRLLATPPLAVAECRNLSHALAHLVTENLRAALSLFTHYDPIRAEFIQKNEPLIDKHEDRLGSYLVQIGTRSLGVADNRAVSLMLHTIGDWERIGDHALHMATIAAELQNKENALTEEAETELAVLFSATGHILQLTCDAYTEAASTNAIEPLSEALHRLTEESKARHVARLRAGRCGLAQGYLLADLLTDLRRVGDHCSNISAALSLTAASTFEPHQFLSAMHHDSDAFAAALDGFLQKYALPK